MAKPSEALSGFLMAIALRRKKWYNISYIFGLGEELWKAL